MHVSQENTNMNSLSAIFYDAQNKYIMGILHLPVPSLNSQNVYHILKNSECNTHTKTYMNNIQILVG
jgi:hypothetical protein